MMELDLSEQIRALRSTFADIKAVVGVERLTADIAALSDAAGAADLWDNTENAQQVTSRLSHAQAELARIVSVESRLDDLEVLVDLANEAGDAEVAAEATAELAAIQKVMDDLEIHTPSASRRARIDSFE